MKIQILNSHIVQIYKNNEKSGLLFDIYKSIINTVEKTINIQYSEDFSYNDTYHFDALIIETNDVTGETILNRIVIGEI